MLQHPTKRKAQRSDIFNHLSFNPVQPARRKHFDLNNHVLLNSISNGLNYGLPPSALSLLSHPTIHRSTILSVTFSEIIIDLIRTVCQRSKGSQIVANIRCRWGGEGYGHRDLVAWSGA